ncbi:hypothetical protein RJ639_025557 [Escallonia herrerae]|uniref:Uncharacterized protein n=1 Tax=Escallonia herrerae TaxID=1293975 RepID=A0AA88UXS8_9ASTE|nr:hypothetical protein RJ639_025557 [Escallonia herrerae]
MAGSRHSISQGSGEVMAKGMSRVDLKKILKISLQAVRYNVLRLETHLKRALQLKSKKKLMTSKYTTLDLSQKAEKGIPYDGLPLSSKQSVVAKVN